MNRKGKKTRLTRVKATKVSSNKKSSSRKSSILSNFKQKSSSIDNKRAKSNNKKSAIAGVSPKKSRPKLSLAAKKNTTPKAHNSQKFSSNQQQKKLRASWWLALYAVAIAIGMSTILGTAVGLASSWQTPTPPKKSSASSKVQTNSQNKIKLENLRMIASLGKEINVLKVKLEELTKEYPELEPKIFLVDLDTKGFVSIKGKNAIASASTIKLPILVAFFQDLDQGKIKLEEDLTMTKELIAKGSGDMQHQKPGTKFSALETAEKMMVISDNTATNMLIKRLGGKQKLNQRFIDLGLTATKLNSPLPDLEGTNSTTPEDLGNLLVKIDRGSLLSMRSRDRLLYIMRNIVKDTLLPQGLESGAIIAHKTGDIKSVLADVGMIDMPNGKRYIASVLVKRP